MWIGKEDIAQLTDTSGVHCALFPSTAYYQVYSIYGDMPQRGILLCSNTSVLAAQ